MIWWKERKIMGWAVKQYPDGKLALWSTVSDGYIVRKAKREYVIEVIKQIWRERLDEQIKELETDFPNGWRDKDTGEKIIKESKDDN